MGNPLFSENGNMDIIKEFANNLPEIIVDPEQLRQVFINQLVNAREAMPESVMVTIKTKFDPQGSIEVSIPDNGPGIQANYLAKIFEQFFKTKPQ